MYDKQHVNYKLHKDIKKTLSKNTSPVAVTFFIFFYTFTYCKISWCGNVFKPA